MRHRPCKGIPPTPTPRPPPTPPPPHAQPQPQPQPQQYQRPLPLRSRPFLLQSQTRTTWSIRTHLDCTHQEGSFDPRHEIYSKHSEPLPLSLPFSSDLILSRECALTRAWKPSLMVLQGVDMSPEFASPHILTTLGNTLRLLGRHSDAASKPLPPPPFPFDLIPPRLSSFTLARCPSRDLTPSTSWQVPYYRRAINANPAYPKAYLHLAMTLDASSNPALDRLLIRGLYLTAIRLSSADRDDAWTEASLLLISSDLRSRGRHSGAITRYRTLTGLSNAKAFERYARHLALPIPSALLPEPPPAQEMARALEGAAERLRGEWHALQGGQGGGCAVGRFVVFRFGSNIVSNSPEPRKEISLLM